MTFKCKGLLALVFISSTIHSLHSQLPSDSFNHEINFLCYTGSDVYNYTVINYNESRTKLKTECFNDDVKTTAIFFPGWQNHATSHDPVVDSLMAGMLERGEIIPITIDYETLMMGLKHVDNFSTLLHGIELYTSAVKNSTKIADCVANVCIKLYQEGAFSLDNIRFIGFSLGAQIMAEVARQFTAATNLKFPRITALDPVGPKYHPESLQLSATDAVFVDVIHTATNAISYDTDYGTAEFYFNFPSLSQPACEVDTTRFLLNGDFFGLNLASKVVCSHLISVVYYAESVTKSKNFPTCTSALANALGICEINADTVYAGYDVSTIAAGRYYLHVKSTSPYGMGTSGP